MAETTVSVPGSDGTSRAKVTCNVTAVTNDSANNRTLVRIVGKISDNSTNFGGFGTGSWSATLDGVSRGSGSVAYNFTGTSANVYTVINSTYYVSHATNGSKTVSGSVTFNGNTNLVQSATATASQGLTDYVRVPTTPAAPTLARSVNGTTLTITGAAATFYGTTPSYQYQTSTDGGTTYSDAATLGTNRISSITVTNTDSFVARTRAIDSEGTGAYSDASTESIGVPDAPSAAPTLTRTADGTSITLNSASATRATAFSYQQSIDGTTWGSTTNIASGTSVTITDLVYDQIYYYKTLGRNSSGSGAFSAASSIAGVAPSFTGAGTDTEVANAILGTTYNDQVVALRARSYSIFSGSLPTGLSLNTATGAITGTPSSVVVFTFSFVIRATNNAGSVETEEFTITVSVPADGSLDTTFDNNTGTGANGSVDVILLQPDGDIVIGGQFTTVNGVTSNRIARLNSDGTLDTAFSTNIGAGLDSVLKAMAIQYEKTIVIGGAFTTFNSISKPRITRISGDITP